MRLVFCRARKVSERCRIFKARPFCAKNNSSNSSNNHQNASGVEEGSMSRYEAYRQLDKLDFATAAKILFTSPPKKKQFGIDFHLVQLFFACMPSLAVYLVAQYARYEMRKMEEELEKKKKAEEEEKAKEMELNAALEEETESDPELLKVKVRLDKLEETIKEIVVESKKQSGSSVDENQEDGTEEKHPATSESNNTPSRSEARKSVAEDHHDKPRSEKIPPGPNHDKPCGLTPETDASQPDLKTKIQNGGGSS